MNKIKVCYTKRDNLGDAINPLIFNTALESEILHADRYNCDMTGIGSGLRRFFVDPSNYLSIKTRIKKTIVINYSHYRNRYHKNSHPLYIWSAGFLNTPTGHEVAIRNNIKVYSVRGYLSKLYLEQIMGEKLNECSTGDAGLLASELISTASINKQYKLGIIPHDKERHEKAFFELKASVPNSVIIDVRGDVMEQIRLIASCETIISSSLHGLIIADSFLIPNRQAVLTKKLSGDGFKFKDYYSCWGLDPNPIRLDKGEDVNLANINSEYQIDKNMLDAKKKEIKEAFYRCSEAIQNNR